MHASATCPSCGAALPDTGGARQCPACLLRTGMNAETLPCDAEDYADGIDDTEAATTDAPREAIGTMIGRYRLLQEIGEGGFGIVYMAEQSEPVKRKVALKVLKPGMDTREVVSRFEAERQALAVMDHPNIAQVYDGGATDSGRPYFVMELVKGVPVTRYCDDHRLLVRQRLELFLDVLLAVQHAHQKGVIHRDLKPSNILVNLQDGKAVIKVIDFGIAKAVGPEVTPRTVETGFGQMIGTPQYMSPEQAELNARDVDTRSDIYSLGVVLYELLTGRTPLDAHRIRGAGCVDIQRLIREQEPAKPSARYAALEEGERKVAARRRHVEPARLAAMLRGDLDWVVMKALEKVRARRYQTANALAMDIRRFLDDEPVSASPPSTVYRFAKFARRHKFGVAWTAVISAVILTAAVGMTLLYFKAERERLAAQRSSWEARMAQVTALRWSGRPERRFEALDALSAASANPTALEAPENLMRMRDAAIACLAIVDMKPVDSWQGNPGYGSLVSANRAMTEYACTGPDGRISILSYPGRTPLEEYPGAGQPVNFVLKFSPDGKRLAAAYGQDSPCQLKLWTRGGDPAPVTAGSVSSKAFDFFPDGRHCAAGRMEAGRPVLAVLDAESGIIVREFPLPSEPHSLSVSRDGRRIAASLPEVNGDGDQPGYVIILDAMTGAVTGKAAAPQPRALAWSPVEDSLAVCSGQVLRVWHDEEWTAEPLELPGHSNRLDAVAWSPDGRVLASQGWDGMVRLWDPAQGTALSWHPGRGSSLGFSADGSRLGLLIEGARLTVLEVAPGDVCYRGRGHAGGVHEGVWNKAGVLTEAGLLLATSGNDGVRFWNREGRHLGRLPVPDSRGLAFSADSLYIGCREALFRCRMTMTPGPEGITVAFAPREKLHTFDTCEQLALSADDGLLALAGHRPGPDGGKTAMWLVDLKSGGEPRCLEAPERVANCALSEDGRWLAAGTWKGNGVRIWQLPEAAAPLDLPIRGSAKVAFSPDGRWLATGDTESYRFWKSGTWELKGTVPSQMGESQGAIAFTPRKTAIAIARRRSELKILHPITLQEMSSPDFDHEAPLCFDRDGRIMVTFGPAGGLFFWKLETLRAQLRGMDLDWDKLDPFEPKSYPALRRVAVPSSGD